MAKDEKNDVDERKEAKSFENKPSTLDPLTHEELRLMYDRASEAVLFSKNIQWRSVGSSLVVFGAIIAIDVFVPAGKFLATFLTLLSIVLATGVVFVLVMYQWWQFNEINRIVEIEKHFSSLYIKIRDIKDRRDGNLHRYTLLFFMCAVVVLGAVVTNIVIKQTPG
ncbi:MAG: hypothetical protein OQJ99_07230 [Rhodospirillales bacterium]|nr:hypothetical protein [Rhodospirillales bacterium]MCW8861992.1 hypothetical protein [Rhodospirillales bacterium]MCW8952967.1 hypothetical protein [Rhodospirillales bacterium]MCW8970923.1 hypothetical protein [Rhodospirillales bacterium]MCW9002405.1 hypothetical protein [Rhodospirillales bacterium]